MQTRKTIEYDVKTLHQTVLDTMKSLRHADDVPIQSPESSDECARVSIKEEPDEIRKRGGYNVKI